MIFEMVNSMEIHIICCVALVKLVICLLARVTYLSDFKILNRLASVATSASNAGNSVVSISAYCAENPGVLRLWPDPDGTVVSKFVRPPPLIKALFFNLINAQGVSVGLIIRDGLGDIITEQKKYRYFVKKIVDRCIIYVIS
jgi:hypothetical protein